MEEFSDQRANKAKIDPIIIAKLRFNTYNNQLLTVCELFVKNYCNLLPYMRYCGIIPTD